jgi:hypothetical protein
MGLDHDTRNALERGNFWGNYVYCVEHYRWWRWKDDDPSLVDYVGHPMMGAVTSSIYEQNDPKKWALMFENTQRYWMGRLRTMAYSAAYSAQWKVGPLSETSIGSTGLFYYIRARDGIGPELESCVSVLVDVLVTQALCLHIRSVLHRRNP